MAAAVFLSPAWSQAGPGAAAPASRVAPALTLEQALAAAYERSPLLAAARNEAAASEGQVTQAGVIPNPSLEVGIDDNRRSTRTTTTALSMPVELGGKRGARITAAGLARERARRDLSRARVHLPDAANAAVFAVGASQQKA
ncbi:TolC family protein, partial [Achromobacter ruhlandii]